MLPEPARTRLPRFLDAVDARVHPIEAIWIGGSIALGEIAPHSDVDVVVATEAPVAPSGRVRVRGVDAEWLTLAELAAAHGLVAVTRAIGVRAGIAVRGPPPAALFGDVDHAALASAMRANVETYWRPWLAASRSGVHALTCLHPRRAEWGIVGVPRQLVTIAEGRIVSKGAGARWLRERSDACWHRILDEAVRLRRGERSLYHSPFARRRAMRALLAHAIELAAAPLGA
jgi:hypothetical protein